MKIEKLIIFKSKKIYFWEMYALTQVAALQSTEKNKFQLKGGTKLLIQTEFL